MSEDPLTKLDKKIDNHIEDLIYGKEDIITRHARREEQRETYQGFNDHVIAWVPGVVAYCLIKNDLKNPEYTTKQKVARTAMNIGFELFLNTVRIGGLYGVYKFNEYLWSM